MEEKKLLSIIKFYKSISYQSCIQVINYLIKWKNQIDLGKYTVIKDESNFKLKIIEVNPGQRLSYQYHNKRSEVWTIVEGSGEVVDRW